MVLVADMVDVVLRVFYLPMVLVLPEFLTLGVPADAVGCLPAPLRFGLAKKPARLPSSPPNATATAKATAAPWTWEAEQNAP